MSRLIANVVYHEWIGTTGEVRYLLRNSIFIGLRTLSVKDTEIGQVEVPDCLHCSSYYEHPTP